jgi:enediyne biosynthesis protein E5
MPLARGPAAIAAAFTDPRHIQIAAQTSFLVLETLWLDFGPSLAQVATMILAAQLMEWLRARLAGAPANWKSALSTGLSLSLLLRSGSPVLWAGAAVLAVGSKYVFRSGGKHIFNPSAFAIVALLLMTDRVWVSPGQWGTTFWLAALAGSFGGLVLTRVARLDLALGFLGSHLALLLARAWYLGDPWTIPLHQIQSGGLLIFALFMITDPRSTPDSRIGRMVFAALIAVVAHAFLFRWQVREGVFYALVLVSCLTPIIDRIWPGSRFSWPGAKGG